MSNMVKLLYRRVSPGQWRTDDPQTPEESLFYRRPNEESLSVFDAEMATPTAVLEHLLNLWIKQNRRGKLKECGGTIKGLRELGWGVAAFEVDSPLAGTIWLCIRCAGFPWTFADNRRRNRI